MGKTIIYLVHGTWPYGPFGKRSSKISSVPWFSSESDFSRAVGAGLEDVEFRTFEWDGRNRFSDRSLAAQRLAAQITLDAERDGEDASYVVIAHSHGGTVSANALAIIQPEIVSSRVRLLVCMATPFAYWAIADVPHRKVFTFALNSLLIAAASLVLGLFYFDYFVARPLLYAVLCAAFGIMALGVQVLRLAIRGATGEDYVQGVGLPIGLNVVLIRAPADEATLSIGFAQALQGITREFFKLAEPGAFAGTTMAVMIAHVLVFPLLVLVSFFLATLIYGGANPNFLYAAALMMAPGVVATVFIACHALLALSVGYLRVGMWAVRSIEVEVAPLDFNSNMIVLSADPFSEGGMRHAVHERNDVREIIRRLIAN